MIAFGTSETFTVDTIEEVFAIIRENSTWRMSERTYWRVRFDTDGYGPRSLPPMPLGALRRDLERFAAGPGIVSQIVLTGNTDVDMAD